MSTQLHCRVLTCLPLVAALAPQVAAAQTSASGGVSLTPAGANVTGAAAAPPPKAPTAAKDAQPESESWLTRYKPVPHLFEIGIFGGAFFPSENHNLRDPGTNQVPFDAVAPEIGLRFAYFPFTFAGVELEGAAMPTGTRDNGSAGLATGRAHLVGQLPFYSIVPFVVIGAGFLGAGSDAMGDDTDPALHFGAGVKVPLDDFIGVRFDVRDVLSQKTASDQGTLAHHPELTLGLTLTLDRRAAKKVAPPADTDSDGLDDSKDKCPTVAAKTADGCPLPEVDTDADGIPDSKDDCRVQAGPQPTGCPPADCDKDGIPDSADKCPGTAAKTADGCPVVDPDPDGDGVLGDADLCPKAKETENGYKDEDGCPDELPEALKKFDGAMQGIQFGANSANILGASNKVLDDAVKTLTEYPDLRLVITGHTDNQGGREGNIALSLKRAESVKAYLVKKGIDESRLTAEGKGPDEPIAANTNAQGRAQNRRIEFHPVRGRQEAKPAEKVTPPEAPAGDKDAVKKDAEKATPAKAKPAPRSGAMRKKGEGGRAEDENAQD